MPGQRRGQGHALARLQVAGRSAPPAADDCPTSAMAFSASHVAQRVPALVDGVLAGRQRESALSTAVYASMACVRASMPLSAVTFGGHDTVSSGSTSATARPQVVAQHADLDVVVGVGEHRRGRHLGAGAGRRRHADQRQDRAGHPVVADVVARRAAVREHDGGDLGQVHVAAAAEADHGIGTKRFRGERAHWSASLSEGSASPSSNTAMVIPDAASAAWTGSQTPA